MIQLPFANRAEAGRQLGVELLSHNLPPNVVVLALPRGGLPVGLEVAQALAAPLDAVIVRKLGVPWRPELAMGAIAGGSFQILDEELIEELGILREEIEAVVARERTEAARREKLYRGNRGTLDLHDQAVLLVDDGFATGSTMSAAARYVRSLKPRAMFIAAPVGSIPAVEQLNKEADACICLATPEPFSAVGEWYADFRQVTDAEVQRLLKQNRPQSVRPEFQNK
jgi:putative phosphoribosyl transferase